MSRRGYEPCMCGATDCPSCGPAQGFAVVRRWDAARGRYVYVNPEEEGDNDETEQDPEDFDLPDDPEPVHDHWTPS